MIIIQRAGHSMRSLRLWCFIRGGWGSGLRGWSSESVKSFYKIVLTGASQVGEESVGGVLFGQLGDELVQQDVFEYVFSDWVAVALSQR
jgi:hypothetical protein